MSDDLLTTLTQCPACRSPRIQRFYQRPDDSDDSPIDRILFEMMGVPFQGVRYDVCGECGLLFLNPRWTQAALGRMYGEENLYRRAALRSFRIRTGNPNAGPEDYFRYIDDTVDDPKRPHGFHALRAKWIMKHIGAPGALAVDVGAGFGAAQRALESAGFRYRGFESSPEMVAFARRLGRTVENVPFAGVPGAVQDGDVVYTAQFFEHVDTPVECMKTLRGALRDGGYLFVDVPSCQYFALNFHSFANTAGVRRFYMNWGHMLQFDHVSLANSMRFAGFEPTAHRYVGACLWMLGRKIDLSHKPVLQKPHLVQMALNVKIIDPLLQPVNRAYRGLRRRAKRAIQRLRAAA